MRERTPTFIIGSYSLGREGLRRIIGASRFEIVASATSLDELPLELSNARECPLLISILDDDFDASLRIVADFKQRAPLGRVAIVGRHWNLSQAAAAFDAGCNACLAEGADGATFVKSLELVMLGETIWPREVLLKLPAASRASTAMLGSDLVANSDTAASDEGSQEFQLSRQEMRILDCLAEGESNKQIARKLEIAEATVKVHVKAILRKMRVSNRTQAAVWALRGAPARRPTYPPDLLEARVRNRAQR